MLNVIPLDLAWLRSDFAVSLLFIPAPESKERRNGGKSDFLLILISLTLTLMLIKSLLFSKCCGLEDYSRGIGHNLWHQEAALGAKLWQQKAEGLLLT